MHFDNELVWDFMFSFWISEQKFVASESTDGTVDTWEDIHMLCPNQCVCQHSPLMDLSVARWIQGLRREDVENSKKDDKDPFHDMIFNEVEF